MKRIVSIQDLSCVGKCSLSIALPVLSVMGLECVALPTALLSAHTAFDGFYSRDLTDDLAPIAAHWQSLDLKFDTIASGYLGSCAQAALVEGLFARFPTALRFVDPAMGDHGRLYSGVDPALPEAMRHLVRSADVITPNLTEACLLTGLPYTECPDAVQLGRLLDALLALGAKTAIITGIRPNGYTNRVAVAARDGVRFSVENPHIAGVFHGTGDLFAAVCAGALTLGLSAERAVSLAADLVRDAIAETQRAADARWYGVQFEPCLGAFAARVAKEIQEEETK